MEVFEMTDDSNRSPFASITLNDSSSLSLDNVLRETIKQIMASKVCETTGLNINQLLELPTDMYNVIMRSANSIGKYEAEVLAELEKNRK